jgi:hypothetical protein
MDSNHRCLDVGQESSPLDHGTIAVAELGIEPTIDHHALDLVALPICVLGRSSCGGRIRTGARRLMRPCWKPDSSPLRSDQGESRTPTPVTARRSERRVSACSTTWPISSPYGNRTHPSSLRGWRPFADRRTGRQCVGQELNLHSVTRVGYSHLGSPMPSRRMLSSSTGGNRTHKRSPRFELGRFAGLRTVPACGSSKRPRWDSNP